MRLNEAQRTLLFAIQGDPTAAPQFEAFCAEFEAALDEVERPVDTEATAPFGVAAMPDGPAADKVSPEDAALLIAAAWLEMAARAINDHHGEPPAAIFDEDGVAIFNDTRSLFDVASAAGVAPARLRRACARVRGEAAIAPRALKILGAIRAIRPPKRKARLAGTGRVRRIDPRVAHGFDRGEIARAKAGTIIYALVERGGTYAADRLRKSPLPKPEERRGVERGLIAVANVDEIQDFVSPFVPCPDPSVRQLAVDHFVSYLEKKGHTYQRLVFRD